MALKFVPGVISLANLQLLDREYALKREAWKKKAPKHLLHPEIPLPGFRRNSENEREYDKECGNCWLAKQSLLMYNPDIYIWDGRSAKMTDDELEEIYEENVKKIEKCSCLEN